MTNFEDILEKVGSFHRYQHRLIFFIFLTTFMCSVNYYNQIFIFAAPPHRCRHQSADVETRFGGDWELLRRVAPWDDVDRERGKSCYRMEYNMEMMNDSWTSMQDQAALLNFHNGSMEHHAAERMECHKGEWIYDYDMMFSTIASENDWVCELDHRAATLNQFFWVGNVFGCLVWGVTNDVLGRKPTVLASHVVYFTGGVLTFFASSFPFLLFCRFMVGMAHHTVSHLPYLIALEYCGRERRTLPLLAMMASYALGSLTLPWLTKLLPSWHYLLAMATFPNLIVILGYKWVPESPGWLLCKGQYGRAADMLSIVAEVNGKDPKAALASLEELRQANLKAASATGEPQTHASLVSKVAVVLNITKYPRLLTHLALSICMCVVGFMCYYGHVENTSNLGEDITQSFFFGAAVEIPAYSVSFLINYFGRKSLLLSLFTISGATSIGYGYLPEALLNWRLCVALSGRMFATGAYYICLQYASELLPTVIRGSGVALCEIMGGIGLFLCPMIVYLGKSHNELPLLIFGGLSLLGASAVVFLPETAHVDMPQSMEDGNDLGKGQGLLGGIRRRRLQEARRKEAEAIRYSKEREAAESGNNPEEIV